MPDTFSTLKDHSLNLSGFIPISINETQEDLIKKGFEVYTEQSINQYKANLTQHIADAKTTELKIQLLEKGKKDLGKLTQKTVTDKRGHQRKVWVKTGEDINGKPIVKQVESETASAEDIQAIVHGDGKKSEKVRQLLMAGVGHDDKNLLVELTGAHYSQVHSIHKKFQEKGGFKSETAKVKEAAKAAASIPSENLPKVDVNTRWESYDIYLDMVAGGLSKSLIAFGTGGVGKTYTMKQVMERHGKIEFDPDKGHTLAKDPDNEAMDDIPDYDYVKITGKSTPTAMYAALYEHNGKTIVFDDCDSVLQDETSINIFKGALDTSGDGTVSYKSGRDIKTEKPGLVNAKGGNVVPSRFKFNGNVIFISNLAPEDMPQPLVDSRSLAIDLSMSVDDTVERLRTISNVMPIEDANGNKMDVSTEDRQAAVEFINEYKNKIRPGKLNARTLGNMIKIKLQMEKMGRGKDWKKIALTTLSN